MLLPLLRARLIRNSPLNIFISVFPTALVLILPRISPGVNFLSPVSYQITSVSRRIQLVKTLGSSLLKRNVSHHLDCSNFYDFN
jgi:hypothetical protein